MFKKFEYLRDENKKIPRSTLYDKKKRDKENILNKFDKLFKSSSDQKEIILKNFEYLL